jgi:nicotinamidase-related amidase
LFVQAGKWREKNNITPAHEQQYEIRLIGIDLQRDFCLPDGALFVAGRSGKGAVDDSRRIAEFIYRNIGIINKIKLTLDTHYLFQIFFAPFWITKDGGTLAENTMILVSEDGRLLVNTDPAGNILHEDVRPNPAVAHWICDGNYKWLFKQVLFYCKQLAEKGKYTLYLWPPHCLLGTEGHTITGVIHEAIIFHNFVRHAEPQMVLKGGAILTESYDPAESEVSQTWDGKGAISSERDVGFYEDLRSADALIIVGQAASHCVASMVDGLLNEIRKKDPELAKKIYIVTDCMSAVTISEPDGSIVADYTLDAEKSFEKFANAGVHLVKSTTPLPEWPDIKI